MRVLIAPDSFKESLSSQQAATAIATGLRSVIPDIETLELAIGDGGEGTTEVLVNALGGTLVSTQVIDPQGEAIEAQYGLLPAQGETPARAVIEIASASGLERLPLSQRRPLTASSFGTGQLMLAALDQGVREFIIALGGSATNDGAAGILQALGCRFFSAEGELKEKIRPQQFPRLTRIDLSGLDPRLTQCSFSVACDVNNPLLGERGASAVFGPQKGASAADVAWLDQALANYANLLEQASGSRGRDLPGAGAAGGAGFGLMLALNAQFSSGVDLVLDTLTIDQMLCDVDLVISGEGCLDSQSFAGKAPFGVARRAEALGKPVILITGVLGEHYATLDLPGVSAVFPSIAKLAPPDQTLDAATANLQRSAAEIGKTLLLERTLVIESKHSSN